MPELPEVETTKTSLKPLIGQQVTDVQVFQSKLRWPMPPDLDLLQAYCLTAIKRRAKYLKLTFKLPVLYNGVIAPHEQYINLRPWLQMTDIQIDFKSLLYRPYSKILLIHLGMSGSLQQLPIGHEKRKHDHVIITFKRTLDNWQATDAHKTTLKDVIVDDMLLTQLHYHDPRRFGAIVWGHDYEAKLFNHLGLEPLTPQFDADYLYRRIHRLPLMQKNSNGTEGSEAIAPVSATFKRPIRRPIKSVIMDQRIVVGVGNIYATESLFLAGIHPSTSASLLSLEQLSLLVHHIKIILQRAIELGGSTLRDFTVADGTTGYFQQTLQVYGRHKLACPTCATDIDKVMIEGRASTFCINCQPLDSQ